PITSSVWSALTLYGSAGIVFLQAEDGIRDATVTGVQTCALPIYRAVFFELGPDAVARAIYGGNPFPESVAVGRYLKERTRADDRIVVIGSEPEVYFYARRRAGTRYIYMYPLFENQPYAASMQDELIRDVETVAPR